MKILFVVSPGDGRHMGFGGAQIHVRDLARALDSDGHEVSVATNHSTSVADVFRYENSEFVDLPDLTRPITPLGDVKTILQLRKICAEIKPDIVSLHSSKPGVLGRVAMIGRPTVVIFTAHGWSFTPGIPIPTRGFYMLIEFFTQFLCDKIVTVSDFDRKLALAARFRRPKLQTIRNGSLDRTPTPCRKKYVRKSGTVTLVTIARFSNQKDHETLFNALQLLPENVRLIVIGGGKRETINLWESRLDRLGLCSRVKILGEINNVFPYLEQADVFVLSSNWEGLPRAVIESMMMGLPVVATNVGGVSELVEDGKTGFLVGRRNHQELAERVTYLLDNPDISTQMGWHARQRYEKEFQFERMYESHLKLYKSLLRTS